MAEGGAIKTETRTFLGHPFDGFELVSETLFLQTQKVFDEKKKKDFAFFCFTSLKPIEASTTWH